MNFSNKNAVLNTLRDGQIFNEDDSIFLDYRRLFVLSNTEKPDLGLYFNEEKQRLEVAVFGFESENLKWLPFNCLSIIEKEYEDKVRDELNKLMIIINHPNLYK